MLSSLAFSEESDSTPAPSPLALQQEPYNTRVVFPLWPVHAFFPHECMMRGTVRMQPRSHDVVVR